ncbi:MAG: sulfatase-like hydrolase/transferase [Acidovorax sp.]|uniref:sulfatase-like hydrolase/transferase n=1 Tax=Acidovorax sp. TaxID=1872122 RepID=UPI002613C8EF|nr:sulfatase-like hydrolase/transferase [Acidovorax sp.]MDH4428127.1 sulfatase-like hydrolase/transferase [Acidovorax sp.]MDH4462951.1 sulfatase-like hydrolase/transferase [Acidovorax sp.]
MSAQPNIIFILADDLGFADLGCYGGRAPVSPHLDRMASEGLRFTQGYSNSPVCSPTRFALMTGRYQYHFRGAADEPLHGPNATRSTHGLPPSHQTLPSLLREAGYRTGLIGKWHLGHEPHFGPLKSGYDEHFGLMSGGIDYFTHTAPNGKKDLWHNGAPVDDDTYLTDLLSDRSVDFIQRSVGQGKPFFLSLHYTAPHWPWETREDHELAKTLVGKTFHLDGGSVETYHRMIHHMDEGIGKIMAELKRLGQDENTLVVFTSDNGGERFSDSWPLVGGKMDLTEGGIRVPYIVRWPVVIAAGGVSEQLIITMDWVPTLLEAAQARPQLVHPLDGVSILPHLRDASLVQERQLCWRMSHRQQRALRCGRWKYLRVDGNEYLFDLEADARERANQMYRDPYRLADLRCRFEQWEAGLPPIPEDVSVTLVYTEKDMP